MTTPLVYPASLPGPISMSQQRAERRALTGLPGPRARRALWRDRLDPSVPVTFRFRTLDQAQTFVDWLHNEQVDAGAWFAADWRVPQGGGGVFRFLQLPAFPQWLAPDVWECSGIVEIRGRSLPVTAQAGGDPFFDHVGYLLHFDGFESPQDFPDVKSNLWVKQTPNPTYADEVRVSPDNPKFGLGSLRLETSLGTSANLTLQAPPIGGAYSLGTGNLFTLEGWLYWSGHADSRFSVGGITDDVDGLIAEIRMASPGVFNFTTNLSASDIQPETIPTNTWVHVALTYDGTSKRTFVGGVKQHETTLSAGGVRNVGLYRMVNTPAGGISPVGYIDECRFTFGVCRYTADFAPPVEPFPDFGS